MKAIFKFALAILLGMFIHSHWAREISKPSSKPGLKSTNHRCPVGTADCRICSKKSALSGEPKSTRKEIVFHLEEGQVLTENQISFNTPEGKEEYRKRVGWLRDICDDYAFEQYQKRNGIVR
jgi:hypothetical protein